MPAQASSVAMIETGVDLGCIGPSREIPSGPVSGALILREDCPAGLNAPPGPEPARGSIFRPPEGPFSPAAGARYEVPIGAPRVAWAAADAGRDKPVRVLLATEGDTAAAVDASAQPRVEQIPAECLGEALDGAQGVVSVCPRTWFPASDVLSCNNGARRFLQPTGDLPRAEMVELVRMASDIVCDLDEFQRVAWAADICLPHLPEDSPAAVLSCADALRQLHAVGLAGETVVVTLGRSGSVLGDWRGNQVWFLEFRPLDARGVTDTPPGTGDDFLGALALFAATWADGGFLRAPGLACTLRATHYVATRKLHLPRESYTVEMTRL